MLNLKQLNDNYIYIDINKIDSISLCTDSPEYYVTVDMVIDEEQLNKIINHNKFNFVKR